ncbi:hypothetical protein [Mangrovivirga cuniculi]|uniref:Outer membrane protein beta-barrel domain-containing protein n=1 Tax=Mangrovivirga cuniculi TaxID=2715131 RepID=A0A4D7JV19_9BACT|nr:hypothetical protein [Mangrovivirga cuniculi]QCK16026.1 hypothetical protein DCC35_15405 [Mangrovivirga cuniculi]
MIKNHTNHEKLLLTFFAVVALSFASNAQGWGPDNGTTQLSVGVGTSGWGVPVFADVQFGVSEFITVGPRASYSSKTYRSQGFKYNASVFTLAAVGNYHYSRHLNIPRELDLYGGLELGYAVWNNDWDDDFGPYYGETSTIYLGLRAGVKYFFNPNIAAMLEVGGGTGTSGALIGVTFGL